MDIPIVKNIIQASFTLISAELQITSKLTNVLHEKLTKKVEEFLEEVKYADPKDLRELTDNFCADLKNVTEIWNRNNKFFQKLSENVENINVNTGFSDNKNKNEKHIDSTKETKPSNQEQDKIRYIQELKQILPKRTTHSYVPHNWHNGNISFIENLEEGSFFLNVHTPDMAEYIDDISKIQEKCSHIPELFEIVAVCFEDNKKYRAIRIPDLTSVTVTKQELKFYLIDTGEEFECKFDPNQFFKLPDFLQKASPLAIHCKIEKVISYDESLQSFLQKYYDLNETIQFEVMDISGSESRFVDTYHVNLRANDPKIELNPFLNDSTNWSNVDENKNINMDPSWEGLLNKSDDTKINENETGNTQVPQHETSLEKLSEVPRNETSQYETENNAIKEQFTQDQWDQMPSNINITSPIKPQPNDTQDYKISRQNMAPEDLAALDEEEMSTSNPLKAVIGYVPSDESKLCKYTDEATGGCFKGGNCRLQHLSEIKDGWTRDKDVAILEVPVKIELPAEGFIDILIVSFESVSTFYAHIMPCKKALEESKFGVRVTLSDLQTHMNCDEEIKLYQPLTTTPNPHELVIAPYQDGRYYRATVTECVDKTCSVFYVDYGHGGQVKYKDLRKYSGKFSYLPIQAIKMKFANITVKDKDDAFLNKQACEMLNSICNGVMRAEIVKNDGIDDIYIRLFNAEGFDIGEIMIKNNLVKAREDLITISKINRSFPV